MMKQFTVAVVGGGIAGLALANLLEKLGIHYLVFEAYPRITSQSGTSIGWHPHGLRILDSLGLCDQVMAAAAPVSTMTFRTSNGTLLYSHRILEHIEQRCC
ncbi:hypothetical protein CDD81_2981 [Ophiocordyceps australis]|uniref:FAD-binding domain-containing protein n=1 Tax=Ophiocordyceps australis TaxID=1399860 RepID=A0A2C5YIT3_9HYPO|nr:hypothetical protein CDD81_2981 [Ophiocordyceps australis]